MEDFFDGNFQGFSSLPLNQNQAEKATKSRSCRLQIRKNLRKITKKLGITFKKMLDLGTNPEILKARRPGNVTGANPEALGTKWRRSPEGRGEKGREKKGREQKGEEKMGEGEKKAGKRQGWGGFGRHLSPPSPLCPQ